MPWRSASEASNAQRPATGSEREQHANRNYDSEDDENATAQGMTRRKEHDTSGPCQPPDLAIASS
jgi:hypothetical protein